MSDHLLLLAPSVNRVYAAEAPRLVAAEVSACLPGVDVEVEHIAGADYLRVDRDQLSDHERMVLSNTSATYALFAREGELLRPVEPSRVDRYGSDLQTILKYSGKTNEQFTRLVLNVTAAATRLPERLYDGTMVVADPMCGRGTTLNVALTYGLDVWGIDLDAKDFEAYQAFLTTYLRQHRLKHTVESGALRLQGKPRGKRFVAELAPSKDAWKAGDTQRLTYLCTDTTRLKGVVRQTSVDAVVVDTPYGVQHGSHGQRLDRRPADVLDAALPGWVSMLRTGGAVGLAYNRHVVSPSDLAALVERHGLSVVGDPEDGRFRHRVDASIDRDVLVAAKN